MSGPSSWPLRWRVWTWVNTRWPRVPGEKLHGLRLVVFCLLWPLRGLAFAILRSDPTEDSYYWQARYQALAEQHKALVDSRLGTFMKED